MNNAGPSAYESARKIPEKRCCLEGDPRCLETSVATRRAYREPMPIVPSDAETRVYSPLGVGEESAGCRPPLTITLSLTVTSSWMSWSSMSRSGVAPPTASPQHQLQANKNWSVGMYRKAPTGAESLVSNWLSARGVRGRAFPCDRDFTREGGEKLGAPIVAFAPGSLAPPPAFL